MQATSGTGIVLVIGLVGSVLLCAPVLAEAGLTFEERVQTQQAIERVYHSHQIGATKPFEQAVPRALLEHKVRKYLRQSSALEELWHTPITTEALDRELQRMVRGTRMPARLRELFAALDDDPVRIREGLVRPTLSDRLVRSFFADDDRVHGEVRRAAESLREALATGAVSPWTDDPRRVERDLPRVDAKATDLAPTTDSGSMRAELPQVPYESVGGSLPRDVGDISAIREEREKFVLSVVLEQGPTRTRTAEYSIPKESYDAWWLGIEGRFDDRQIELATSDATPIATPIATMLKTLARTAGTGNVDERPNPEAALLCVGDDVWDNGSLDDGPIANFMQSAVWTGSVMLTWRFRGERYDPATDTFTPISAVEGLAAGGTQTAIWTGEEMIVWGGYPGLDTGARYDPASDTWTPVSGAGAPAPRYAHAAVWTGGRMIVWGGWAYTGEPLNTGGLYDPETDTWTATSTIGVPSPRPWPSAVWTGEEMIVWGGGSGLGSGGRYDPVDDSWTLTPIENAPAARQFHAAVWTGDKMVVWGGASTTGAGTLSTGGLYDPIADTWTPTSTTNAPTARSVPSAVWTGDRMIVWGGASGDTYFDTGGLYDPAEDSWTPTSTISAPPPRYLHSAVWAGERMIVWGGHTGESPVESGGRYDPATDSWTPTAEGDPSGENANRAVWTGNTMIVWGGSDPTDTTGTGARYDPATDSWMATSATNAPSPRDDHTAVWTGDRMIIWGGALDDTELNTGGRYDPLSDTWAPTAILGAPSGRREHSAVWTGELMIVWGGRGENNAGENSGGRYDPATDTWLFPTTSLHAPAARRRHTAVWTGSQMIVWGGEKSSGRLNTGGRYDPSTNSWLSFNNVDGPEARVYHSALWTGQSMVVWGGENASFAEIDNGGRYDPFSDSWSATSLTDAPTPRRFHSAVWTGSSMIVWGGTGNGGLDSGGRYDPATDSWTAISELGAPEARWGHTAVWTGGSMIVWGGQGFRTGGRYFLGNGIDDDGDGLSECGGDCNDVDAGAFARPAEVSGVLVAADKKTLIWNSAVPGSGTSTVHDVLRGSSGDLNVGGATCLAASLVGDAVSDPDTPEADEGFWYLVRGRNICGPGSYGDGTGGTERVSFACP